MARSIVIDEDGMILAGNGVVEAAAEVGITRMRIVEADGEEVIAVRRTGLTPEQKRALAIYDNRTAELATWNVEQLLADQAAGLPLQPWWSPKELGALLGVVVHGGQADPDEVPATRATDIQRGDMFELGKHRLLCGDCLNISDLDQLLRGQVAKLLITSPPYNQRIDTFRPSGMHKEGKWVTKVQRLAYSDSLPEIEYQKEQRAGLDLWFERVADAASVFYNHKNRYREKCVVSPLEWLPGPFRLRQEIVWSRPGSVTQNARMFLPSDERIYWLYKGDDFFFNDTTEIKSWASVWTIGLEANQEHAVGFPTELPRRCLMACSQSGDVVLEPYAGSGTTIIACEQLDRQCRAVEILPVHCQVIIDRWEAFTGQTAIKVGEAVRG